MSNPNRSHSRRKRPGLRCIRCIRAKKGPCVGSKPTCDNCALKNLLCVWEDELEDEADDELSVVAPPQPSQAQITVPIRSDGVEIQPADGVHIGSSSLARKHRLDDDSASASEEPAQKRKRGRPLKSTMASLPSTNSQPANHTTQTDSVPLAAPKPNLPNQPPSTKNSSTTNPRRTKLIHTEFIHYESETYRTLVDTIPRPLDPRYRYPSPSADYAQAPPFVQVDPPWVLHFPRIYVETVEVEIGPLDDDDDGQDEWRRLPEGVDGGHMAWPGGRWVQEGPETFRWVQ